MASITWKGVSGDWTNAADWNGGTEPGAGDTANFTGANAYTVTLYSAASVGNVVMNAASALFYDAGALTLGGTFTLQSGTFALAYGSLNGGTLVLAGGTLAAEGGMLNGVAVDGTLNLSQAQASLFVQGGLNMAAAGGGGAGAIQLTGSYAALNFLGSQQMANANVSLGATGLGQNQGGPATLSVSETYGATSGATLTLASNVWVRETGTVGQIIVGGTLRSAYTDAVVNQGTLTDAVQGSTLTLGGSGNFVNQGTIGISGGATLDIAGGGFSNTGTMLVTDATLAFGGTFATSLLGALGHVSLTGATVEIEGTATNAGQTLNVSSGSALGPLELAGTITGGTVLDAGGGLNFAPGSGDLDALTYVGTLNLAAGAAVTLSDSTVLATAGNGAGTANVGGAGAALMLEGVTTLDNATITVGATTGTAAVGTTDSWLATQATTATLGPNLVITQGGTLAAVDANATTPIPGFGLADTLINQGTINANFAGGTFTIGGYGSFINQGTITASNQASLLLDAMNFSNTGTIALSGGATAVLGGPPDVYGQTPAWSNSGVISLSNATLMLSGAMQTGQIGQITGNGTVALTGTLNNTGATLTLGSGGQLPALSLSGTIIGGTIVDPGGNLTVAGGGTADLSGLTETGTLNLTAAGAYLRIQNGMVLYGAADITGAGSDLAFQGTESFGKAQVALGASGTEAVIDVLHNYNQQGGSTLTLGQAVVITQSGPLAGIGTSADVSGDAIINYGNIIANVAGGTFNLGGADFINRGTITVSGGDTLSITASQVADGGTISVSNAALSIGDSFTMSNLGSLVLNNAVVDVAGTLNNSGATLALGAGTPIGKLELTGTISGGVIQDQGLGLAAAGNATLNDVEYEGELNLSYPFQTLTFINGIDLTDLTGTQPGTMMLTGAATRVLAAGNETLNNATVYLGSIEQNYYGQHVNPAELAAGSGSTLTIGSSATVRSAGFVGWLGDCSVGGWSDTIINDGTVLAATAAGILTLGSTFFINNAGIAIGNDGNIMFAGVDFSNFGTISISPGSDLMLSLYSYFAAPNSGPEEFVNSGLLRMVGGALVELTGGGEFPNVPILNAQGGTIQGVGNILAPVINDGFIEAKYGPNLSFTGSLTGNGTLQIDNGCVLELGGAVSSGQTVDFTSTGQTLRLDSSTQFSGVINNFISGDAIDIANLPVTNLAISNGTLVLGTQAGQARLHTAQPLGGELSVSRDTHNGSIVNYKQQAQGSGAATISVFQPNMLFWASPVGDIFTGTAANMANADISNWTTADSLDITDMVGTNTTVAYAQANGQGTITVTDGVHTDQVTLIGSYNASWFHVNTDPHGGAIVVYAQS